MPIETVATILDSPTYLLIFAKIVSFMKYDYIYTPEITIFRPISKVSLQSIHTIPSNIPFNTISYLSIATFFLY